MLDISSSALSFKFMNDLDILAVWIHFVFISVTFLFTFHIGMLLLGCQQPCILHILCGKRFFMGLLQNLQVKDSSAELSRSYHKSPEYEFLSFCKASWYISSLRQAGKEEKESRYVSNLYPEPERHAHTATCSLNMRPEAWDYIFSFSCRTACIFMIC